MAEMGRPKIEIDWEQFDKLCARQCTLEEIATWFDCSADTIERRVKETYGVTFAERFALKRQKGFISLRNKCWELAMAGNTAMCIWLSKQYLGQTDKVTHDQIPVSHKSSEELTNELDSLEKADT